MCELSKSIIFDKADLYVTLGERTALLGPNGCGKTSFIKMLLGEMNSDNGQMKLGANLKIAYLPQNITFENEDYTVIECFRQDKYILEGKAREYLAKFMFYGKDAFKKVKQLSGGEKVRLKLSMLIYDETNLLILDESTNHLDIDAIETLEEALEDFQGTILFISHDRYFINKVCSKVVAIEENKFTNYEGNYDFYKNKKKELQLSIEQTKTINKEKALKVIVNADNRKSDMELYKLENNIKLLEDDVKEIELSMSTPGVNHDELNKLYCKREEINKKLDAMIGVWLSIGNNTDDFA